MRRKQLKIWSNKFLSEFCLALQDEGVSTSLKSQELLLYLGKDTVWFKSSWWSSMIYLLATQEPMKQARFHFWLLGLAWKNLLIGMKGQMDWPRPGAQRLVLEEPSGAYSYALVKKPVRAQNTTQSFSWRPTGSASLSLTQKHAGLEKGKT